VWGGYISRGSATLLPQGAGPKRYPIFGVPFYLCTHPLTQNYQILHGNIRGLFLDVQSSPTPRGPAHALPNFGGAFLFMHTPFDSELPNLTW